MGGPTIPENERDAKKVRISRALYDRIRELAVERQRTIRELVERALEIAFAISKVAPAKAKRAPRAKRQRSPRK